MNDQGAARYTREVRPVLLHGRLSMKVKSEDYRVRQDIIPFALENNLMLTAKDLEH